ncbi:hypothetical protein BTO06_00280 [Tenacibaculum sp. SZ-18]|uniref:hypothetical protein n=1 Tax=Tenacibaculum sp. SZ-18 TaxID=754423 RepID=UPI000C2D4F31|nr:hypothetical protein [Tenacibaculum sp. SZ-18]AUC13674.1 hypothetical protein BTO06_00280 [Tenacibaculum sp. SZ-18]
MTTIAVKRHKDGFKIASDSQITINNQRKWYTDNYSSKNLNSNGKIFRIKGATIGYAGIASHFYLLQMFCDKKLPKMNKSNIINWCVEYKSFVIEKMNIKPAEVQLSAFLIKDNKCFFISSNLTVYEVEKFDATGSGAFIALAAMEEGASVKRAVKIAIKYDLGSGGKIHSLKVKNELQ